MPATAKKRRVRDSVLAATKIAKANRDRAAHDGDDLIGEGREACAKDP